MTNHTTERGIRRFRAVVGAPDSRRRRAIAALAIATVLLFVLAGFADEIWDHVVEDASSLAVDLPVQNWMVAHRVPGFTEVISAFSISGGPLWMPIIVGITAIVLAVVRRSWTPLVLTVLAAVGSLLMTIVGKSAVGRERPPIAESVPPYETSFSFPSGHSLNSLVLAGIIGYLLVIGIRSRTGRVLVVVGVVTYVLAMGTSRLYLGHHWVSDVLMAWVLGAAWITILITAHRLWLTAAWATDDGGPPPPERSRARSPRTSRQTPQDRPPPTAPRSSRAPRPPMNRQRHRDRPTPSHVRSARSDDRRRTVDTDGTGARRRGGAATRGHAGRTIGSGRALTDDTARSRSEWRTANGERRTEGFACTDRRSRGVSERAALH